ncbi:MAG: hypothetical protein WCA14_13950 [Steroidobacteraceae bacterium]
MTNAVTVEGGSATIAGCATCAVDVPGSDLPVFEIELPAGNIVFHLCAPCIRQYCSPEARMRFRATLLARLGLITEAMQAGERRAALHPEGGRA